MNNDKPITFDINSFIIFDPTLCTDETEGHKKLLYFYPKTVQMDQQIKTIGLCEAMCNFAKEFTDSPCQFIHTQKTRIVLYPLENEMTFVMTVSIPKKSASSKDYLDEDVQNCICETILKHCRQMFFLFMGSPALIIKKDGLESLMEKFISFFDKYIGNGMLDGYHIVDSLPGVQLMPLDEETHTAGKKLITDLERKYSDIIKGSILLFNSNNVVYYTISRDDLVIIYRYIITTLLAKYHSNEAMNSSFSSCNMGKFIINGPDSPMLRDKNASVQRVFLRVNDYLSKTIVAPEETLIVVYKAVQSYVVLFLKNQVYSKEDYMDIHKNLGPELTKLTCILSQKTAKLASDTPYRYLYWNPESLSVKCTLFPLRQWKPEFAPLVGADTIHVMNEIREEYKRHNKINSNPIKEMAVKLQSDCWVIGIENLGKQLFVTISKRNFSLIEASKEIKQICNRDFPNVFKVDMD